MSRRLPLTVPVQLGQRAPVEVGVAMREAGGMGEIGDTDGQAQRPADDDRAGWRAYWDARGMPWRTEPEVGAARRAYLTERRAVTADIARGIYPFRDENGGIMLTRADVEWLLATHASGGMRGPVDWDDAKQRGREGLDLRGADLRGADLRGADLRGADLRELPLARARGSLTNDELPEGGSDTGNVTLGSALVRLAGAKLNRAHLEGMSLRGVDLSGADLRGAFLDRASLYGARLTGADLSRASLAGASLRRAVFDEATNLYGVVVSSSAAGGIYVRDIRWGDVDLTVVAWGPLRRLGDERALATRRTENDHQNALRANRQLATVLRGQGLNEDADRFAYRALVVQRRLLLRQLHPLRWLGSLVLDLIAGYGYRPLRSFLAYAGVILGFAGLYLLNAQFAAPHLRWDEALVLSVSSFHGRGFFTTGISLGDTLARLAAVEAIIGLLIEITFIATFTQRYFAR
jgi:uncharacterized protein YjbI with pentapeptide repeats